MTRTSVHRIATPLLLAALAACSGGDDTTGTPGGGNSAVATVVVTGAPSAFMLVGDSTRLVATPVNATGGVVSNQPVVWTSSAPAVAAVTASGTLIALGAGSAVITAATGGRSATVAIEVAFGAIIGTQGGALSAAGGNLQLSLPAGSVAQPTLLIVRPSTTAPADARVLPSTRFELGPDGVTFGNRVTLTLKYAAPALPTALHKASLQLYMQSGTGWALVTGSTVDSSTLQVTGLIVRTGTYAIRSTPVDRIALSGAAANGAIYAGQTATLAAALLGSANDTLPARAVTWTSSAPNIIAVAANGVLSAVAAGTATITAATDGKTASTEVAVLARPSADWSRAGEWTTYMGNAQHTGYIDASVDPSLFSERWVRSPIAGGGLFQATTGGGRVYLATTSYFNSQRVLALNPATGAAVWQRDFGAIFGLNQATYDGASVYVTTGGHGDTYLYALNEADGTLRYQSPFGSQFEHWKAPVVAGSAIVTAGGSYGGMYGFDKATGSQLFFRSGSQVDGWGPAVDNGMVYITDGGVKGISPTTGSVVVQNTDSRLIAVTTPVVAAPGTLLAVTGGRMMSVSTATGLINWEQSATFTGAPVAANGAIYAFSGNLVAARALNDGALLWSWSPPEPYTTRQAMALVNNVLFVSCSSDFGEAGITYAIDIASHRTVWSYPLSGELSVSGQGVLYIVAGARVAAINLR